MQKEAQWNYQSGPLGISFIGSRSICIEGARSLGNPVLQNKRHDFQANLFST